MWRDTGVERLEGEDPPQPFVLQELPHRTSQRAEAAESRQPHQVPSHQVDRRVEAGADEPVALDLVQPGEPRPQITVSPCLPIAGELTHGLFHLFGAGVHVQCAAVGERRAVRGVQGQQFEVVPAFLPHGGERVVQQFGHREHGRTGVDPVAVEVEAAREPTGMRKSFEDGDLVTRAPQVQCGGQAGETCSDHDHLIRASFHHVHHSALLRSSGPRHDRRGAPARGERDRRSPRAAGRRAPTSPAPRCAAPQWTQRRARPAARSRPRPTAR